MDAQTIFDTVATHLAKQGHQALNTNGACVYLAENGDKCAAGCLIGGDTYTHAMEGVPFGDLVDDNDEPYDFAWPSDLTLHTSLVESLQMVHDYTDHWESRAALVGALRNVAAGFNLHSDILNRLDWSAIGR